MVSESLVFSHHNFGMNLGMYKSFNFSIKVSLSVDGVYHHGRMLLLMLLNQPWVNEWDDLNCYV